MTTYFCRTTKASRNMGLAFQILFIVLFTEAILWFGYSQIASLAYGVYLFYFKKEHVEKQRRIKRDILNVKHELGRTSSQDQFAKWAKLRRKLDSKMNDLDNISKSLNYMKTSFEVKFTTFLWILTNFIQFIIISWYISAPVFYLPQGWFRPATWIFSLPFAPAGSVSVPMWFVICRKFSRKLMAAARDGWETYLKYVPEPVRQQVTFVTTTVKDWLKSKIKIAVTRAKSSQVSNTSTLIPTTGMVHSPLSSSSIGGDDVSTHFRKENPNHIGN
ncbi:hypothetical protein G9A89_018588 [Geosiphon pyriformis]|nr:hypothetical protein G9A89_018588 [Geosiphon pyriformis]